MRTITLTIPGKPFGKQMPRSTRTGINYTPTETKSYMNFIKMAYVEKYGNNTPFLEGALFMSINAYFPIPVSTSNKQRLLMLEAKIRPAKKPDLKNILAGVEDSLEGLCYQNDSHIVEHTLLKWYAEKPRVEVCISEIEG